MASLAEIYLARGRAESDAALRRAAIEAQRDQNTAASRSALFASLGNTAAQALTAFGEQRQQAPLIQAETERRGLESQLLQGRVDDQNAQRADAALEPQRQQTIGRILAESREKDPQTGQPRINQALFLDKLTAAGMADRYAALKPILESYDKNATEAATRQAAAMKDMAGLVADGGYTAEDFVIGVDDLVQRGLLSENAAMPLMKRAKEDPNFVKNFTMRITGQQPEKLVEVDPTKNLVRPTTGEVVTPGVPAVPKPANSQSEDFLLNGNRVKGDYIPGVNGQPGRYFYQGQDVTGQARGIPPASAGQPTDTSKVDPRVQTVLGRVTANLPTQRRQSIEREVARLTAAGDEGQLKSYLKYAAVETQGQARKDALIGRMETLEALNDAEELLKQVPTGYLKGSWENVMRELGKTSDPRLVELGTMMGSVKANYIKSISGAAVTEGEAARLGKLLPDYKNELPVNMGVLKGFANSIKSFDEAFYKYKFGDTVDWVLGSGTKSPASGALSAEDLIKKYGGR